MRKNNYFFFNKFVLYTFRLSKKSKHVLRISVYQKDIQSKVSVGLAGHKKAHHIDVWRKDLTTKKQRAKLLIKSFTSELTFGELNVNKL